MTTGAGGQFARLSLLGASLMTACASVPPSPSESPEAPQPIEPAAPLPPTPLAPTIVEPPDARLAFEAYRARVEPKLLGRASPEVLDALATPPVGHRVLTVAARREGYRSHTLGFGRRAAPHAFGSAPRYVELAAESARSGAAIREVLSRLGQLLHDPDRPLSLRFGPFVAIRLDQPIVGERFFALVPHGEVALAAEHVVTVLLVVPLDEADFIPLEMRGDGAVRAWYNGRRGSGELLRAWDPVLDRPAASR